MGTVVTILIENIYNRKVCMIGEVSNNFKENNKKLEIAKKILFGLERMEYGDVCVHLSRLVVSHITTTECTLDQLVEDLNLPDGRSVSIERSCGLMAGYISLYVTSNMHNDKNNILKDALAVSGFDFKKILGTLDIELAAEMGELDFGLKIKEIMELKI